mmetsp:Transcript_37751/g.68800  ORF Transcript_37751/g.68800 Transcript_37751/m.68800 type:complete len:93 (+) Transcript_37751:45-323(+)
MNESCPPFIDGRGSSPGEEIGSHLSCDVTLCASASTWRFLARTATHDALAQWAISSPKQPQVNASSMERVMARVQRSHSVFRPQLIQADGAL